MWACCATTFASDFSGPLQDVQVTVNGSLITYSVVDPVLGNRQGAANTPGSFISTPANSGGVVTWVASDTSGSRIYYVIYDPGRSNWIAGFSTTAATSITGPLNDSGVVAWQAGNVTSFVVYDPLSGTWKAKSLTTPAVSLSVPKNRGGIVAWNADQTVYYVAYDPIIRSWISGFLSTPGSFIGDIQDLDGVVAWPVGNNVHYRVYDPNRAPAWREGDVPGTAIINNLTIANSTVYWSSGTPSQNHTAGYNSTTGLWTGSATPVHASFLVSAISGNPPLFIWFTDLSLGGTSWSWNFGDGATAVGRTPYHAFNGLGRYQIVQTVAGPAGTSTANTNILTDLMSPSGAILINNDDSYTRSASVMLTISVTDNSGVISAMRFSNTNNANWSSWMPYSTSLAWTLSAGDGLKSVYGQFTDPSSNLFNVSDSITLDSRPAPLAFVTNYFVGESTPMLQVAVQLSDSTHFKVSVDYSTSDGTATAGSDYGSAHGTLVFFPGETAHTFRLYITNDTLVELNETILVTLSNPVNATVGGPATVTIMDDDPPTVSFSTSNFTVEENAGPAMITVSLNAASGMTPTINYATSNGTATAGTDYTPVLGTLTFSPGQTTRSFVVPVVNETVNEASETVLLYLSNPTNALLGAQSRATLTILDDNPPQASLSTNRFQVSESAGTVAIPVRLANPFMQTVYVDYATSDGTAKAGTDYVGASGTLVFAPGVTNRSFLVTLLHDVPTGTSETLSIGLTGMVNATPGAFLSATLTILDDGPVQFGSASWQTNTGFHSTLSGAPGHSYAIDVSSNLLQWSELTRITNTTGTVDFADPAAAGLKKRFYRARQTN